MKIKYLKTDGVKFSAIDVPVNVCGREAHLVLPFVCATKRVVDDDGSLLYFSYSSGLTAKKERLIIKYYNDYILRSALEEIRSYKSEFRESLIKMFEKHNEYFHYYCEGDFFKSVGMKPYVPASKAREIVTDLLKKFSESDRAAWCLEYVDKYFTTKNLLKEWDGYADSLEDMALLQKVQDEELTEYYINDILNDDEWCKRFTKLILLPYVKKVQDETKKREEEKKKKEIELADLKKQRAELDEKIAMEEKYLSEL